MDALTPQGARLVSQERSERRNDRNQSGIREILDHILDVLVGGGSLFVEQLTPFADNPATQRCLGQLVRAEALAHAQTGLAPRPLAAGSVSQRPGVAFALADWLHEVAERPAGTGDYHRLAFGRHGTLAMDPNRFPLELSTGDGSRPRGIPLRFPEPERNVAR
jgi:hypothetical protein